jgi:hypothetical protein
MDVAGQANGWLEGVTFDWKVSNEQPGTPTGYSWYYEYTVWVSKFAPRRLLIETDPDVDAGDITNVTLTHNGLVEAYDSSKWSVRTHTAADNNGGLPADTYGILFDSIGTGSGSNETVMMSFWSNAAPRWGDFYTRCDGNGNRAFNTTFTDVDPIGAVSSGSLMGHVLVPGVVPEPAIATVALAGGLLCLTRRRSR